MVKSLYVEIDDLFDTRLSFLNILTKDKRVKKINYHNRIRDNFGSIPFNIFNHYYSYRNKYVLRNALPTKIFDLIIDFVLEYIKLNESELNFKLYINIYPYDLTSVEIDNLQTALKKTFLETDIEVFFLDPYELDLDWIVSNIDVLVMYNGIKWLEYKNIIGEIRTMPITDKTLVVPFKIDGVGDSQLLTVNDIELYKSIYKSIVDLQIIDLNVFGARVAKK